jgi:hypothetical protein
VLPRKVVLGTRPTLEQLGQSFGVTRERIRQIESKGLVSLNVALRADRYRLLRWRADDLLAALGSAVVESSPYCQAALTRAVRGLDTPDGCSSMELLLWIAGPYERDGDWLVQVGNSEMSNLHRLFDSRVPAEDLVMDADRAISVLDDLRVPRAMVGDFMATLPGWRSLDVGTWMRWAGAVQDKAYLVLRLLGRPASIEEINSHIGEGHAGSSLRNQMSIEPRFARLDKANNYGLTEWGLEEYSGIAQEIVERIQRTGGPVLLEDLVIEFVDSFGVSATSVRTYAASPAFVLENGLVGLRPADLAFQPDEEVARARGVYVFGDGRVSIHDTVDADVLRGSGRKMPEPAAAALGIRPGRRANYDYDHETRVVVSWPAMSANGPSLGSVREIAHKLELAAGAEFRVIFDPSTLTCTAEAVDRTSLRGLTGLTVPDGEELATLAAALRADELSVRSRLQARGDNDVLALLPSVPTGPDLSAAIDAFGDLLGG